MNILKWLIKSLVVLCILGFSSFLYSENWKIKDSSEENLINKCDVWMNGLTKKDKKVLSSFFDPKFVEKHKKHFDEYLNEKIKNNDKKVTLVDYKVTKKTVLHHEKLISVRVFWESKANKRSGETGCNFYKQKDGSLAFQI